MNANADRLEIARHLYIHARTDAQLIEAADALMAAGTDPDEIASLDARRKEALRVAILADVVTFIRRFVVLPTPAAVLCGLWVQHAHAIEAAEATPYLIITSPEKRSGKSRLLEVLKLLVPNPLHFVMPSEAVLFRTLNDGNPTLLLDEVDAFFHANANDAQEGVRAILNAGHERGATVPRCLDRGKSVEHFNVFGAKALAGIGDPPDTVLDRGFRIAMRRRKSSEARVRFRRRDVAPEGEVLRDRCAAFALEHLETLREARPEIPEALNDRAADAAEPLLAIADLIGGPWPERARVALLELAGEKDVADETEGGRLLADVKSVLGAEPLVRLDRVRTDELLRALREVEGAPWSRYGRRREPLEADELARLLRPFGVRPKKIRRGTEAPFRGYVVADFTDAFDRYAAPPEAEDDGLDLTPPPEHPGTPERSNPAAGETVPPPPEHDTEHGRGLLHAGVSR